MQKERFEKSYVTLEFDKILQMLSQCAFTEGGKALCTETQVFYDSGKIAHLQAETTDSRRMIVCKGTPSFGGVKDISGHISRAEKGAMLTPGELLEVANVFRTSRGLLEYYKADKTFDTVIDEVFLRLIPNKFLEDKIYRAIISQDTISDEASPNLSSIRRRMRGANGKIRELLQKYITSPSYSKFLQENIITIRSGRYVIPVKSEYRNEIKGLVHDTSSSGSTLFIEPMAVVTINNEIKVLEKEESSEIERILYELSADVSAYAEGLRLDCYNITYLDAVFARGRFSLEYDGISPVLISERRVDLKKAKHPLLDKSTAVPIDIRIGGAFDTLIITGPNTGGKTVSLKTLGLLSMMHQSGLHIPADEKSEMCVFGNILADIGDEQSIEQSLSTFSAHMTNIVSIMKAVNGESLVLFDELGAGTDPVEGAALATAILESVRKCGALCASTTHYAELKAYAIDTEGVCNASCEFDVETLRPTYKLVIGTPGRSNAFAIASKLGLDDDIISNAARYVNSENRRFEEVISKLDAERAEMERMKEETRSLRDEFEAYKNTSEKEIEKRLAASERELQKARDQARSMVNSAKASSDFIFAQLSEVQKHKEKQDLGEQLKKARDAVRKELRDNSDKYDPVRKEISNEDYVLPRPLKIGDNVLVTTLGSNGVVKTLPDKNGNLNVSVGALSTRVNVKSLRLADAPNVTVKSGGKSYKPSEYSSVVRQSIKPEIDVRGFTGDDAWFAIDKYFDEAMLAGFSTVTVIHGKGTGALRAAITAEIRADKRVKSFRAGVYGEGDSGVTVVEFK